MRKDHGGGYSVPAPSHDEAFFWWSGYRLEVAETSGVSTLVGDEDVGAHNAPTR